MNEITLVTRGLIDIASKELVAGRESTDESISAFFDDYKQLAERQDAIIVNMNDDGSGTESSFDGDYFYTPHAIGSFLAHEDATHILLRTFNRVCVFVIEENEDIKLVVW
ncbi:hypothetical protein F7U66_18700 [Vibrio parahaemolyticus]|nr:hypothetical protein [Vibrio parahaemolyticus]